jgi:hypothetical protein
MFIKKDHKYHSSRQAGAQKQNKMKKMGCGQGKEDE